MNRSIFAFVGIFAAIFAGSYMMMLQGKGKPQPVPVDQLASKDEKPKDEEKTKDKEEPKEAEKGKAKEPARPAVDTGGPLVLKTWNVPASLKRPDRDKGLEVIIDPIGPKIINQNRTAAVVWDSETGVISKTARMTRGVTIENTKVNDRSAVKILDQNKRELLVLKESPTRDACVTPDGGRVIAVGNPGMYSEYTTVEIPSGKTTVHPAEIINNVRLFEAGGLPLAEWGPKRHKLDDDIHAVAMAPDGRSFFVLTKQKLMQISFAKAFNVQPLSPR
jgi:hypothetical protein